MKRTFSVFILSLVLFACGSDQSKQLESEFLPGPSLPTWTETFTGILPCNDCPGIRTSLTLFPDSLAYRLTEDFSVSGEQDSTMTRSGIYQIEYGLGEDTLAVVIRLDPASNQPAFFLLLGDSALEMLDAARSPQANPIAYRLRKNR